MGPLLLNIAQTCLDVNCTPVLLHHTKKSSENAKNFEPLDLEDLAYAGVAEFARQWILLSRRQPYDPANSPGQHKLWLVAGGSAGHSGLWGVDVDEGILDDNFGGRKWVVAVTTASIAIQGHKDLRDLEREQRQDRKHKNDEAKFLGELDRMAEIAPDEVVQKEKLRIKLKFSGKRINETIFRLADAGLLEELVIEVKIGSKAKREVAAVRRKKCRQ